MSICRSVCCALVWTRNILLGLLVIFFSSSSFQAEFPISLSHELYPPKSPPQLVHACSLTLLALALLLFFAWQHFLRPVNIILINRLLGLCNLLIQGCRVDVSVYPGPLCLERDLVLGHIAVSYCSSLESC